MHDKSISDKKIQWHPGFYAAAEIELRQNRADLEYHREYNLSKKPYSYYGDFGRRRCQIGLYYKIW